MPRYAVSFSTYGVAEVTADDPQAAIMLVADGLGTRSIDDAHWDYLQFDGSEINGNPEPLD